MFINGINNSEYYTFEDVFEREKFFYLNSTIRIIGWETPISIIYVSGEKINICFKRELWDFAKDYVDPPFSEKNESSIFDTVFEEEYYRDKPARELKYALQKYKEAGYKFEANYIYPDALMKKLQNEEYFAVTGIDTFNDLLGKPHNCHAHWFPVDVDAIIIDENSSLGHPPRSARADIVFPYDNITQRLTGYVGFDGNFYLLSSLAEKTQEQPLKAFSIKSGLKAIESKLKINHQDFYDVTFLKSHIIAYDGTCYDYEGNIRQQETIHQQNVNFINGIIYKLTDFSKQINFPKPPVELKVPDMLYTVDIDIFDTLVIPALQSINALDKKVHNDFLEIKKLIVYAGLNQNFTVAMQNIRELNETKVFGGSSRGLASKLLIKNLNILKDITSKEEFAALLNNGLEIKKRIAHINGSNIAEISVTGKEFSIIVEKQKISERIEQSDLWKSLHSQMLVIFTNSKNEQFCATTQKYNVLFIRKA